MFYFTLPGHTVCVCVCVCVCLTVLIHMYVYTGHSWTHAYNVDWVYYFVFSQVGDSPLHLASHHGHLQIVKLLIQNGASSTQCNDVSVIVKQVIHVPLCAHVQVRYMVIFVCLCVYLHVHVHVCVFHVYLHHCYIVSTGECSVLFKYRLYDETEEYTWYRSPRKPII